MNTEKLIQHASKAYYEGQPIMSDEEFDELEHRYNTMELDGEPQVGYTGKPGERAEHTHRMYSLQKHFAGDPLEPLASYSDKIITPKLDGASVALTYEEGVLVCAITRGDGLTGIDVTDKFTSTINFMMPKTIDMDTDIQITGEVVASKSVSNARNYAAGSLNLKSVQEFSSRGLSFIVHGVTPSLSETYLTDMDILRGMRFTVITQNTYDFFPQDGKVIRLNSNAEFNRLGHTSHHPRGAYALKVKRKPVHTTLLDVKWQVGKSGLVSPVAILDPITIDDAVISKATLHNMAYINELGLEIGCRVAVVRSGDIIPRIVGRVEK